MAGYEIYRDSNSHLMGAIGVAILSKKEKEINFSFDIENIIFDFSDPDLSQRPNNRKITSITKK